MLAHLKIADRVNDLGHHELAQKLRQASRAALDAAFPNDHAEIERAEVILRGILAWLEEFDRNL